MRISVCQTNKKKYTDKTAIVKRDKQMDIYCPCASHKLEWKSKKWRTLLVNPAVKKTA